LFEARIQRSLDVGVCQKVEENSVNDLILEVVKTYTALAKEKKINLVSNLNEKLPSIKFDKDRIFQVLSNLVFNALKFTDKGSITISASENKDYQIVSVKDTGIGIEKEDMEKIFKSFVQIKSGTTKNNNGTGLGLTISKKIIEDHKGLFSVSSEKGFGSTFSIKIPKKL
jgi:signal transduction histidine kinase